jgi:hypothetical protein
MRSGPKGSAVQQNGPLTRTVRSHSMEEYGAVFFHGPEGLISVKKMPFQLTDGSIWMVSRYADGQVKFLGLSVDIELAPGEVTLVVNGTRSLMKPCDRVPYTDYVLNGGRQVTAVPTEDGNGLVNILPYDLYVIQPDGTFYVLQSYRFRNTVLPDNCDGVRFIGSPYHARLAKKADRGDIIPCTDFGRTERCRRLVWPYSETGPNSRGDKWPVPYFIEMRNYDH